MKSNPKRIRDLGFYILLVVIMIAVVFTMGQETKAEEIKNYSELIDLFESEKVKSFRTEGTELIVLEVRTDDPAKPTKEMSYNLYNFAVFYEDFKDIISEQYKAGIIEKYDYDEGFVVPWWASFLPYLLIMGGGMFLWYMMMNRGGGGAGAIGKFSKARTRLGSDEKNKKCAKAA